MMSRPQPLLCTFAFLLLTLGPSAAFGQNRTISGVVRDALGDPQWDVSAYLNNVTNERALLSFDQERGTRTRIGY